MKNISISPKIAATGLGLFTIAGIALFAYGDRSADFNHNRMIWDIQWINAWSGLFLITLSGLWLGRFSRRTRIRLTLVAVVEWGIVAMALLFAGNSFGWNSIWGDQQFRIAQILKFMTFFAPHDFYYNDLPPFYPPLYFWILAKYAQLFGLEAYQMMKTGGFLIYLFGIPGLYFLWRKLVTRLQAASITVASFVLHPIFILSAPHEFLSGIFFVPWWLYFVEQARPAMLSRKHMIYGGVIGGLIFMTYYYPFFLGALVLIGRALFLLSRGHRLEQTAKLTHALRVLGVSALVAAPFWLPLLISMISHGAAPAQNRWFVQPYTELTVPMVEWSLAGLLSFLGFLFILRRHYTRMYRNLLYLVGAVLLFLVIGYVLGNFDRPVLYIKATEFLEHASGVFVGLLFAALLRLASRHIRWRVAVGAAALLLMIPFLNDFSSYLTHRAAANARSQNVDSAFTDPAVWAEIGDSVFLTSAFRLPALAPVWMFIAAGEHYGHPAGQFHDRLALLELMQAAPDADYFHLALRHNRYDPVDFYFPRFQDGTHQIQVNLSNYPDGILPTYMHYDPAFISDTALFGDSPLRGCRRVKDVPDYSLDSSDSTRTRLGDTLRFNYWGRMLQSHLDSTGRAALEKALDPNVPVWHPLMPSNKPFKITDDLMLHDLRVMRDRDSLHFVYAVKVLGKVPADHRVYLHLWDTNGERHNADFTPDPPIAGWQTGDFILLRRSLAAPATELRDLNTGLFSGSRRYGSRFHTHINLTAD